VISCGLNGPDFLGLSLKNLGDTRTSITPSAANTEAIQEKNNEYHQLNKIEKGTLISGLEERGVTAGGLGLRAFPNSLQPDREYKIRK
jgi:hypothetical protein